MYNFPSTPVIFINFNAVYSDFYQNFDSNKIFFHVLEALDDITVIDMNIMNNIFNDEPEHPVGTHKLNEGIFVHSIFDTLNS